jgi:hypothetical protein
MYSSRRHGMAAPRKAAGEAPAAAAAAKPEPRTAKGGRPAFDDRSITDLIGKLVRALSNRAEHFPKSSAFRALWGHLEAAVKAWQQWQRESGATP